MRTRAPRRICQFLAASTRSVTPATVILAGLAKAGRLLCSLSTLMMCRLQLSKVKKRRGKVIVFVGLCILSLCILVYRGKESAGKWRKPWKSIPTEDPLITKQNFSRLWNQRLTYEQRKDRVCGKEWQDNFVKLHKDILQSRRPRRFMVFSCTLEGYKCAGYGNRLGGIASILFLSVLTQRAFLIEWDQEVPLDMYLVPKAIEWNYATENIKDLDTRIHHLGKRNHFKKRRNDVVHQWKMKADFVTWLLKTDIRTYFERPVEKFVSNWYFADFLLENPFILKQYVRGLGIRWEHSRDSLIGCAFDFLFHKSRELETRLNAARRSLGLASQVPKLGIQIRMGDLSFGQGLQNNHIDFQRFFFCAQAFGEALARRSVVTVVETVKWFLATDDTAVKAYALKNYPLNAVTLNINPKHIKYSNPLTENTTSQKIEAMFNVVIDHFYCLSVIF